MKPKMRVWVLVDEKHHQPLSRGFSSNRCELREELQDVVMLILFNVLLLSFFSSLKALEYDKVGKTKRPSAPPYRLK